MRSKLRHLVAILAVTAVLRGSVCASDQSAERTIQVNDHIAFSPGYAIGNIAIGAAKVADYKVMPGRREILIFGKGAGSTRLTIWDQSRAIRDEIMIRVVPSLTVRVEQDLREALVEFPTIQVARIGDVLTLTGTARTSDRPFVSRLAGIAKAQDLVSYRDTSSAASAPAAGERSTMSSDAPLGPATMRVELAVLEASRQFRSGPYTTGVEPSGVVLSRCVVTVPLGAAGPRVFIGDRLSDKRPGEAVLPRVSATPCSTALEPPPTADETGIRLELEAAAPNGRGGVPLRIVLETNLPVAGQRFDAATWRRARFQWVATPGAPLAITGSDLLAAPVLPRATASTLERVPQTASAVAGVPGLGRLLEYGRVFGRLLTSRAFQKKSTQLLLLITPAVVATAPTTGSGH